MAVGKRFKQVITISFILGVVLTALLFLTVFILIEIIQRITKMRSEISRKIIHVVSALIVAALPRWLSFSQIAVLAMIFILTMSVSKNRNIFKSIHQVERKTIGEIWFPVGVLASALLFPSAKVFSSSILILGLADTTAEVIGRKYGKHHYKSYCSSKTIEGSAAFFVMTALILILLYGISADVLRVALFVGIGVTTAEALSTNGLDNLSIPIVCGALLTLLSQA